MKLINKILTDDGKEWQNQAKAIDYLNKSIQDEIGYVVDRLCLGGILHYSKKLQCYEVLQHNIEKLVKAHKMLVELSDGLDTDSEGFQNDN